MRTFKRHSRWQEIVCVVGYIDSNGLVHAKIVFRGDDFASHNELFPSAPKYKTWRWTRISGLEKSTLCAINPDDEDFQSVKDWLYKRGLLNVWEI